MSCPAGKESVLFRRVKNARGSCFFRVEFALSDCQSCESRSQCTRCVKKGRSLYLHPQGEHEALHERRLYQKTKDFSAKKKGSWLMQMLMKPFKRVVPPTESE